MVLTALLALMTACGMSRARAAEEGEILGYDSLGQPVYMGTTMSTPPDGRYPRQMEPVNTRELGIVVARERFPVVWPARLVPAEPGYRADDPVQAMHGPAILTSTPPLVYPDTVFVYRSLRSVKIPRDQLKIFAQGLFDSIAKGQGRPIPAPMTAEPHRVLTEGWRTVLPARGHGPDDGDTLLWVGWAPGKWPVYVEVTTRPGKLAHAGEFIRRALQSIEYLD